jgi:hypothetical protein
MVQPPAQNEADAFRQGASEAMTPIIDYFTRRVEAQKDAEDQAKINVTTDSQTGMAHLENVPIPYLNKMVEAAGKFHQIQDVYEKQIMQKTAEIAQARRHPFANTLATIAGSLAHNDPNPITRGLGEAAIRLNPQPAQLEAERNQLLGDEAGIVGAEVRTYQDMSKFYSDYARENRLERGAELAQRKEDRIAEDNKRKERGKFIAQGYSHATTGGFSPEGFAIEGRSLGIPEGDIKSYSDALMQSQQQIKDVHDQRELHRDERLQKGYDEREKIARFQAEQAMARLDKTLQERDKLRDLAEEKQASKLGQQEFTKEIPKLQAMNEVEDSINTLRGQLKKMGDRVGPIIGSVRGVFGGSFLSEEENKMRAQFFINLNATRQLIDGGARFWNPTEYKNLSNVLEQATKSEKANLGIMDALDDFKRRERQAVVDSNPNIDWKPPQMKAVLGGDAPGVLARHDALVKKYTEPDAGGGFDTSAVPKELQDSVFLKKASTMPDGDYPVEWKGKKYKKVTIKGGRPVAAVE